MTHFLLILPLLCLVATANAGAQIDNQVVEAACGQCQFHLPGKGCDLAIRIDGKAYFVDGTKIDEHGDAHAADGLCNRIRKARVSGLIENERFKSEAFQILPIEANKSH